MTFRIRSSALFFPAPSKVNLTVDTSATQMHSLSSLLQLSPVSEMSEQEVLFFDEYGTIVPDGIDDPGYVTDCMAWGILDDKSGRWHATGVPPPREYFNCLRYLNWIAAGSPPGVVDTRQIPLKEMNDYPTEHHQMAVNCAYGMWADEFFARVPPFGSSSSRFPPMMGPIDLSPHKYNYTEHSPTSRFMSSPDTSSDSQGGIALTSLESSRSTGNWRRTDSVAQSIVSSDTSPVLTWRKGDDKSGSSSPLSRRSTRGSQLSATAPVFQPPVNLALSSGAALPQPPGKIPGTFDVLAQMAQFSVIVVNEAPFNVTINEILTHLKLGEREGIVNYGLDNPAIHIIQDRADSKTHEVYIEMLSYEAAERVIHDIPRRGLKVGSTGGSRKIRVQTTTREKMMQAIFPRPFRNHRELKWLVDTPNPNTMPQSFIGYLTSEDLHNARDWAEHPRKAKHADACPQRVFEFMITTLCKLPQNPHAYGNLKGWSLDQFIDRLFNTVRAMIHVLNQYLDDPKFAERYIPVQNRHMLNFRLLKRLNQTAYDFPLFSPAQKQMLLVGGI